MIEELRASPDYATRIYSLIASDKRDSPNYSLEPDLFASLLSPVKQRQVFSDQDGKPILVVFDKQEALTYLANKFNIKSTKDSKWL